ncbi:hypothetical protein HFO38_30445 [Rhizobium leguminosarum]|uniref:hypothetical protein n=1 Tax=Rhizobium leguminosarum TaxID=384 RepID=UPI001C967B23|nr:hypothetical protein [Rhizobium leguminosarum]MBY5706974.1 hypothetical protein [Rhizobium leguminosarum]
MIALPVRDARAADAIFAEIEALRGVGVPMLLFLTRLELLRVQVKGVDGALSAPLFLTAAKTLPQTRLRIRGFTLVTRSPSDERWVTTQFGQTLKLPLPVKGRSNETHVFDFRPSGSP